ncbi:MAG TPA: glycoside hydrolase, partial [Anaeromyxobacteraceae bacterium]
LNLETAIATHGTPEAKELEAPDNRFWFRTSPEALDVLAGEGVRWAASDEAVLLHSLPSDAPRLRSLYRPWKVAAGASEIAMLFRDRPLSDAIGFTYGRVAARDAVSDFLSHVEAVGRAWANEGQPGPATVGVFLDGENPWEHFPASGRDFLEGLYAALAGDADVETVTLSEAVAGAPPAALPRIHSGSWIESSYRIWMGHEEDRRAWAALGAAREAVARAEAAGSRPPADLERARRLLHVAEGSDWFWWYGEDFETELALEFDGLFRSHVAAACALAGAAAPPEARSPIKQPHLLAAEEEPAREPSLLLAPSVDGRMTNYFEWQGAGLYQPAQVRGTMFGAALAFRALHYGFDLSSLYLRLDPAESPLRTGEACTSLRVEIRSGDRELRVELPAAPDGAEREGALEGAPIGKVCFARLLEAALPFAALGLAPGAPVALAVHVLRGDVEVERLPRRGRLDFAVPDEDFERVNWRV